MIKEVIKNMDKDELEYLASYLVAMKTKKMLDKGLKVIVMKSLMSKSKPLRGYY
jgi:hypothetical protein